MNELSRVLTNIPFVAFTFYSYRHIPKNNRCTHKKNVTMYKERLLFCFCNPRICIVCKRRLFSSRGAKNLRRHIRVQRFSSYLFSPFYMPVIHQQACKNTLFMKHKNDVYFQMFCHSEISQLQEIKQSDNIYVITTDR